jgi:hypothetical protein
MDRCAHAGSSARRLERYQSFVATVEAGQRKLDVVELLAFADAIGFDPRDAIKRLLATKGGNKRQGFKEAIIQGVLSVGAERSQPLSELPLGFSLDVWADAPSLDDGREEKSPNGFGSWDQAVLRFRTAFSCTSRGQFELSRSAA